MKVMNRFSLRVSPLRSKAVISDNRVNSGIEVRLCPCSGDAEVWQGGNHCLFKAFIENREGRALVGLSGYFDQPQDRPGWSELVARCDKLPYEEASRLLSEFATALGLEIENEVLTQRRARRHEKENRASRKRARGNKKGETSRNGDRS